MERNEVSIHEVRFHQSAKSRSNWFTAKDIAKNAAIAERTARNFCFKWVQLGLLDVAEVFPSHRYRLSPKANKRNAAYLLRLQRAADVFGVK